LARNLAADDGQGRPTIQGREEGRRLGCRGFDQSRMGQRNASGSILI